ncbi:MAG: hypothetical protein IAG10_03060 [Planctomycetaceae bacterium]|nr:hypothetical protein [Planctomycetaceae bacterium]
MMRSLTRVSFPAVLAVSMMLLASGTAVRAQDNTLTEDDVIKGTMQIDFNTRTRRDTSGDLKEGSAALGAQDKYVFNLNVAKTTEFQGEILRTPKLFSSVLGRTKQDALLYYNVNLAVLNPNDLKQRKVVGKWVGRVPIDPATGAYDLAAGKADSQGLRVVVEATGAAPSFSDPFAGRLMGKSEKKEKLGSKLYKRVIGGKEQSITVKAVDPMAFQRIELSKGPAGNYPRTIVNGSLDFDYETSNYLTDGITFVYSLDGKEIEDKVTGSIKWVEDPAYKTNGKGYYEFNLRYNEEKNKKPSNEASAFAQLNPEEAFFAVDTSVPCLTGRIEYIDTFVPGSDGTVSNSKVTYHLNANKLTKQQVVAFFKLWLICVGPTNDD